MQNPKALPKQNFVEHKIASLETKILRQSNLNICSQETVFLFARVAGSFPFLSRSALKR